MLAGAAPHDLARDLLARGRVLADLNGTRLEAARPLKDGDTIRLGRRVSFVFRSDADDPTETEAGEG